MRPAAILCMAIPAAIAGECVAAPPVRALQVPILAYHYVKEPNPESADMEAQVVVRPAAFSRQMARLSELGYQTVSLFQLWRALNGEGTLPPRSIVITFDDCCESRHLALSVPILRQHGFVATFFVVVESIEKSDKFSSWRDVVALASDGMELGSHSVHHLNLLDLNKASLREEVGESKRVLESKTGTRVRFFSYPFGMRSPPIQDAVTEAGYLGAVAMEPGIVSDPAQALAMPRLAVSGNYKLETFTRLLTDSPWVRPSR